MFSCAAIPTSMPPAAAASVGRNNTSHLRPLSSRAGGAACGFRLPASATTRPRGAARLIQRAGSRRSSLVVVRAAVSEEESQKTKGTLSNLGSILGVDDEEERRAEEERIERELAAAKKEQEAARLAMQADEKAAEVKRTSGDGEDEAYDYSERAIAGLCYMLPLLDSLKYSKFLLIQFPVFSLALLPLKPLIDFWFRLGFLQILAFFGMYLGVVQNPQMKRFVRFNAQQAVLLDILLIVPDVLTRLFSGIDGQPPMDGPGLQAEILLFNTVFLYTYFSSVVGVGASGLGKTFKLPLVGDAADSQQPR